VDACGKDAKLDVHSNTEWTQQIISMYLVWTTTARASIRRVAFPYKAIPPEACPVDVRRAAAVRSGAKSGLLRAAERPRKVITSASYTMIGRPKTRLEFLIEVTCQPLLYCCLRLKGRVIFFFPTLLSDHPWIGSTRRQQQVPDLQAVEEETAPESPGS